MESSEKIENYESNVPEKFVQQTPVIKPQVVEKQEGNPAGTGEFSYAFKSRDRIPRSPFK